jgi:hypothetical protein
MVLDDEDPDHIKAVKTNGYRNQNNSHSQQCQPNRNNGPLKCTHCKKPGHTVERCFTKFPALKNRNGVREHAEPKIK